eukprot:Gb_16870 [translate_table: standard]
MNWKSHRFLEMDVGAIGIGTSDHSNSLLDSDSEAVPLLIEPGASQESVDTNAHGGKLSEIMKARGRWRHEDKHWSLTQKYAPKTFKELSKPSGVYSSCLAQSIVLKGTRGGRYGSTFLDVIVNNLNSKYSCWELHAA